MRPLIAINILGCLFFFQTLVWAENLIVLTPAEQAWIVEHRTISVAPDPKYHPIEFYDNQSQYRGIAADYIALLEKRLGINFTIEHPRDWNQVLSWAERRKVDMMTSAVQTPQRSNYMLFTSPYLETPAVIISKKKVSSSLSLHNLQGLKVGIIAGDAVLEYIARHYPDITPEIVPDIPTGLKKLSFGMVDAFVGDLTTISYHIENEGITNLRISGQTEFIYRLAFSSRNDWPIFQRILQKGLDSISATERKAIYRKWVHLEPESLLASKRLWSLMGGIVSAVTLIVLAFFAWNRSLKNQVAQKTCELQASEAKYRTILENAVEGMFQTTLEGTFIGSNFALARLLGFDSPAELMSDPELARQLYIDPQQREALWSQVALCGFVTNFEVELCRKNNQRLWVSINARAVRDEHNQLRYIEGFVSDISERKRAKQALQESERRLSTLMANLPGMAYRGYADQSRTMEFVSHGCFSLTGYGADEFLNDRQRSYAEMVVPEDRQALWQQIQDALQSNQPYLMEYRICAANGKQRWVWEQGRGVVSNRSGRIALEGFILDITERKLAEDSLRESERMKTEFVTTAAHEFRTPLTSIQGFSEVLLAQPELSAAERNECLQYIVDRSAALARIVSELLDISRIEARQGLSLNRQHCSVTDIFTQLQPFLKSMAHSHRVEVKLTSQPLCLDVDQDKIGQVFENLLSNALKYSEPDSLIQVFNECNDAECCFSVVDHGIGMSVEQVAKIFNKFYRADASNMAAEGLGLGMSIVKYIVEAHGGEISVESSLGHGTTVRFTLPLAVK